MNATAKWLVCGASLGLGALAALPVFAGPHSLLPSWSLAALAAADPAQVEAEFLKTARTAMKEGRLEDAEGFIKRAEELNVKRDPLFNGLADSPAKVRADLGKLKAQSARTPSSRFSAWPSSLNKKEPARGEVKADPFAARANDATIDRLTDDSKSKAQRYLETGRNCVRNRDFTGALAMHAKAKAENATFDPGEYSPDSLADDLRAAGYEPSRLAGNEAPRFAPQSLPEGNGDLAARLPQYDRGVRQASQQITNPNDIQADRNPLTRGTSQIINNPNVQAAGPLSDARKALAFGDVRKAADFVSQARQQGVSTGGDSPEAVEALIRKSNQLTAGPRPGQESQFARDYSMFLMEQAQGLMKYREYKDAERLAQHAKNVKGVRFGAGEATPDQLLEQIAGLQSQAEPQPIQNRFVSGSNNSTAAASPRRLPMTEDAPAPSPQVITPKQQAQQLMGEARFALERGDAQKAHQLAEQAQALRVPDSQFAQGEMRPWELLLQTSQAVNRRGGNVAQASSVENATYNQQGGYAVQRGMYDPAKDRTRNVAAQATEPGPVPGNPNPRVFNGDMNTAGQQYFDAGMKAFSAGDRDAALGLFKQAWKYNDQLEPATRGALKDKIIALEAPKPERFPEGASSPLAQIDQKSEILRQKLLKEIQAEDTAAERMMQNDPDGALARLKQLRERVAASELEPAGRKQLLTFVDRKIADVSKYIEANRADIDLNNTNNRIRKDIALDQERLIETQNKLAQLVEQFNKLIEEQRYAEAEVIAKQANEIAPQEPVVVNMTWKAKFVKEIARQSDLQSRKERGLNDALYSTEESSEPFDDRRPFRFGPKKDWDDLTKRRMNQLAMTHRKRSAAEKEILAALQKPVEVNFDRRPLAEVMDTLGKMANVNIYLDPQGLHAEGVQSDTPVTLDLKQPISLKSALDIILDQLRLSYVVQHEVLKITSQQTRDANLITEVYNVGDLVIPIPNFTPSYDMGLPNAIREAYNTIGYGGGMGGFGGISGGLNYGFANNQGGGAISPLALGKGTALAQVGADSMSMGGRPQQYTSGPGSLGGAAAADFDSLIDLITTTVNPESWKEGGTGEGTIAPFPTNLSIVVSQTEEVHQAISDLLDQLRRLQDLQVTIEVRFITLNDNFFERIGVDFDFNIDDNTGSVNPLPDDTGPSLVVGLDPQGQVTANRDLQFTQNSFSTAIPQFGGFDPATAANFGFAILSDIEVFFLLQASTGDTRTNVLQAPKVTLFNGQQAVVSDTSQRPFVTSVIPVVGDFAAAHQPVITVLSEGTSLSVQAVVSADRRFVRLTLVPFFSQIGDVEEFTFNGTTTTNTGTAVVDPTNPGRVLANNNQQTQSGTTVQLPTFAFTTVTTTVSVPDGGTVLLGGIKRLSEGRSERGVPLLSKVPYASRLFKNVGIGRTTQSLMMMVTPRIIIQEEEEEKISDIGD